MIRSNQDPRSRHFTHKWSAEILAREIANNDVKEPVKEVRKLISDVDAGWNSDATRKAFDPPPIDIVWPDSKYGGSAAEPTYAAAYVRLILGRALKLGEEASDESHPESIGAVGLELVGEAQALAGLLGLNGEWVHLHATELLWTNEPTHRPARRAGLEYVAAAEAHFGPNHPTVSRVRDLALGLDP